MKHALRFIIFVGNPRSPLGWVWRLLFWWSAIALMDRLFDVLAATPNTLSFALYSGNIVFVSTPFILIFLCTMQRISALQRELVKLAATDPLTGLANRGAFLSAVGRQDAGILLMVDVDHFKSVNDTYGHDVGDAALVAVADHLRRAVRPEDLVGRIGGEEFAVFLKCCGDETTARAVGSRLAQGILIEEEGLRITASVGMTDLRPDDDVRSLMRRADDALYAAKRAGRARLVVSQQGVGAA